MAGDKVIAVVGATGAQGGGLARAILDDPDSEFRVRALTRKPESDAARSLAERGAEVVQADLDDLDSLRKAFEGAYGAYCVTNFWEHLSPEKEKAQAAHMAEAAAGAGLQHVIWSTFEDTRDRVPLDDDRMPTLQGSYKVPHFDAKAEADDEFRDRDVPTTFLRTSFYWENFIHFGSGPQRGEDGVLALTMPMGDRPLPGISAEDIGKAAYGIFKRPGKYIGRTVGVAGEHATGQRMASAMSEAFGEEVRYNDVPADVYRGFPFDGADEMGNMFQFKRDFNDAYASQRSVEETRALNPELQDLETWLARHKDEIPIP
ncbi:MAG: NmrA/HSCARG family protein [Gemmatimonadota bacterium]